MRPRSFPDDVRALLEDPGGSDGSSSCVRLSVASVVLQTLNVSHQFRVVVLCVTGQVLT
jgi:hypothetical protein